MLTRFLLAGALLASLAGCSEVWNNPYPKAESGGNVYYTNFTDRLKHLDPAVSFASDESEITYQIYEMPVAYDYLKRPYQLVPQLAESVPAARYFDEGGRELPADADPKRVAYSLYDIRIRRGIRFQPHPAFVERNLNLSREEIGRLNRVADLKETGTRELTAEDFAYEIKRLAHPRLNSPIFGSMSEHIVGLDRLSERLKAEDRRLRDAQGPDAWLDLRRHDLEGVAVLDRYTYRIRVKGVYPQFVYWLAMPFFTAIPHEVDRFYSQPGMRERNLVLDWYPVGTGPFMLAENDPNARMTLERNPNYREEFYPKEGEASDAAAGMLADAGRRLPFLERIVFTREREAIPSWNKFLQGYYDSSGIVSDNFDRAIRIDAGGGAQLTPEMEGRGIQLRTATTGLSYYLGFNFLDPVVGGGKTPESIERARKLRQAISVAVDWEEFIAIFLNGRGVASHGPVPPGIFGFQEGRAGINPVVYEWKQGAGGKDGVGGRDGTAVRRPIEAARKLLAEAGYPNGVDANGSPLVLYLDTTGTSAGAKAQLDWYRKQFAKLNIQLEIRATDWNRFQEKLRKGNAQLFFLGWDADYPDPENQFFLLYGPNSASRNEAGENKTNYVNPRFDALFERMRALPNGPERLRVIEQMLAILRHDAPWVFAFHPKSFGLYHSWVGNLKPNHFARGTMKYRRIDPQRREALRAEWNRPVVLPLIGILVVLVLLTLPAIRTWRRRERMAGRAESPANGR
jgi:ABC-type transport system substrate-binding protein